MAPEVLSKGTAYDSSADWFSLGCMLYKLLKGHSPFRQHKTKVLLNNPQSTCPYDRMFFSILHSTNRWCELQDKHEIDRMTLTMNVELPDSFSPELRHLLDGLLHRDVDKRLGNVHMNMDISLNQLF